MAIPRTLSFTPGNVSREAVTRTTIAGAPGFFHAFNVSPRPSYRFSMDIGPLQKHEAESLSALFAFHQGGRTFYWDGGQYGLIDECFVAQADGVRRTYFLPNRLVEAASYTVKTRRYSSPTAYVDSTWTHAIASLTSASGVLTFGTAPYSGDHIRAAYCCKYRVFFPPEGLKLDQFRKGLYNAQLQLIENPGLIVDPPGRSTWYQVALDAQVRVTPSIATSSKIVYRQTLAAGLRTTARITERVPLQHIMLRAQMAEIPNLATATTISSQTFYQKTLAAQTIMAPAISRVTAVHTRHQQTLAAQAIMATSVGRATTTLTASGLFGSNVIADSARSTNVFMSTTSQFVTGVPYWNTAWYISSRSANLNVVTFGTAPGSGGSRFDWSVVGS